MWLLMIWSFVIFIYGNFVECVEENCSVNSNCSITNQVCQNGICSCDSLSYFSEDKNSCLKYGMEYKSYCVEPEQCRPFLGENSDCIGLYCKCKENYRWFQSSCQHYVNKGENCKSENECYDGYDPLALECKSGICSCTELYYDRGEDCRKKSGIDNNACALDVDCQNADMECKRGMCTKKPENHVLKAHANCEASDGTCELNIASDNEWLKAINNSKLTIVSPNAIIECESDDECRDMANSECVNNNCQCKPGHYEYENNCKPGIKDCKSDSDCDKNTMCFLSTTCICKRGYFLYEDECIPEIGMPDTEYISDVTDCKIPGAMTFTYNACYCLEYWFSDDANRNCIKTSTQQYTTCLANEWCNIYGPNSVCYFNLTVSSTSGTCECSSFATLNNETYYCEKDTEASNGTCLRNGDCGINQICRNEECVCVENFKLDDDGVCVPVIDGSCSDMTCSLIANARCVGGVCKCPENSIFVETACLKMADNLGDDCEIDEQCSKFENAICDKQSSTKTCVCDDNYVEIINNGSTTCMRDKVYGSPCMKELDCTLVLNRSFQCRKNICQCPVNYALKNGYCVSSAISLFNEFIVLVSALVVILGLNYNDVM